MATAATSVAEQRVTLQVRWETHVRLLAEHPDAAGPRFTYSERVLEIMVVSAEHEQPHRILARLVEEVAVELGIDICSLGSTMFKREELLKGFEPDSAFYVGRRSPFWDTQLDAPGDPPLDLVIEIDISRSSLPRFSIFAAFTVPEVDLCRGGA